jgi:3-phosphoshikimate 1-carboxyvinyltransferase
MQSMSKTSSQPAPVLTAAPFAGRLTGRVRVPGDKSISHRALIFGALASGRTQVSGLLEGADVLATAAALRAMGAKITRLSCGRYEIMGCGTLGLHSPESVLDLGNSGTGARLLMGVVAGHPFCATFTGDASLNARPMARVIEPLRRMGAQVTAREGGYLPLSVRGADAVLPIRYRLPVASAQVKSAVLLAGLGGRGDTIVIEPVRSRDHTERMLPTFGAQLEIGADEEGNRLIRLKGEAELKPAQLTIPADPSSAAFLAVAALILPGSELIIENVCLNPLRAGLFETLVEMQGDIAFENRREEGGEKVADLHVRTSSLHAVEVPASRAPAMIDEYPILAVAAACARGTTRMHGLAELKVKESDRLLATENMLRGAGVICRSGADWLEVAGCGEKGIEGGGCIATQLDHRIAMSALILGLASRRGLGIDDAAMIDTSFPGFAGLLRGLGAQLHVAA